MFSSSIFWDKRNIYPVVTNVRDAPREQPIAQAAATIHNSTSWTSKKTWVDVEKCPPLPILNIWWVRCIIDMAMPIVVRNKLQSGTRGIVDEAFCRYSITVPSSVAKTLVFAMSWIKLSNNLTSVNRQIKNYMWN
jgi:hypothetical protein